MPLRACPKIIPTSRCSIIHCQVNDPSIFDFSSRWIIYRFFYTWGTGFLSLSWSLFWQCRSVLLRNYRETKLGKKGEPQDHNPALPSEIEPSTRPLDRHYDYNTYNSKHNNPDKLWWPKNTEKWSARARTWLDCSGVMAMHYTDYINVFIRIPIRTALILALYITHKKNPAGPAAAGSLINSGPICIPLRWCNHIHITTIGISQYNAI